MTSNWYNEKLCTFPPFPTLQEISTLTGKIKNLQPIFSEACSANIDDLGTPKLKNYVKSISEFSDLENIFNKHNKNVEDFLQKNNVYNLYYTCANSKDKMSTVRAILLCLQKKQPTEASVRKKCEDIENKTRAKFDNCEIRYNKKAMKFRKNSIG